MRKIVYTVSLVMFFVFAVSVQAAKPTTKGFDEFGYNKTARNFVGTCRSWHMGKFGSKEEQAEEYCGIYSDDKLVMKWNAEWDRGNDEGWTNGPYDAWENNQWNGAVPGGSGDVWHYKIKWVGPELKESDRWVEGGYAIWGQFEVIMDHGVTGGEHIWFFHGIPSGYNAK